MGVASWVWVGVWRIFHLHSSSNAKRTPSPPPYELAGVDHLLHAYIRLRVPAARHSTGEGPASAGMSNNKVCYRSATFSSPCGTGYVPMRPSAPDRAQQRVGDGGVRISGWNYRTRFEPNMVAVEIQSIAGARGGEEHSCPGLGKPTRLEALRAKDNAVRWDEGGGTGQARDAPCGKPAIVAPLPANEDFWKSLPGSAAEPHPEPAKKYFPYVSTRVDAPPSAVQRFCACISSVCPLLSRVCRRKMPRVGGRPGQPGRRGDRVGLEGWAQGKGGHHTRR